ncbi:MAG: type II secretion system protein [Myxococcales bacterium]|nr:type II secretion system protein [Myxococcales bacterium]
MRSCRRKPRERGFTLIELMIVVAIIGILAAVAIQAFMDTMRKAKSAEFELLLGALGKTTKTSFVTDSSFPLVAGRQHPAGSACGKTRNVHAAGDWAPVGAAAVAWTTLDFRIDDTFYANYSYSPLVADSVALASLRGAALALGAASVVPSPQNVPTPVAAVAGSFVAEAVYNVDCDGQWGSLQLVGESLGGLPTQRLNKAGAAD